MTDYVLEIPDIRWPYYWELEVGDYSVWVRLCRRPFLLFRNAICSKQLGLVSHHRTFNQRLLDEIGEKAGEVLHAHRQKVDKIHPRDEIARELAKVVPTKVKVKIEK